MSKMKFLEPLLLLAAGLLAGPACSLPGPPHTGGTGGGSGQTCSVADDAGVPDAGSTVIATGDVENEVVPVACSGAGAANPTAIDKYTQG